MAQQALQAPTQAGNPVCTQTSADRAAPHRTGSGKALLNVHEAAQALNMSEHTIRYYADEGLVPSLKRGPHNERLFDAESLNWLQGDHYLRQTGMPIAQVRRYAQLCLLGDSTIPQRYQILQEQQARAQQKLEEARQCLAYINHKAATYQPLLADSNENQPDPMNPATWAR